MPVSTNHASFPPAKPHLFEALLDPLPLACATLLECVPVPDQQAIKMRHRSGQHRMGRGKGSLEDVQVHSPILVHRRRGREAKVDENLTRADICQYGMKYL